MIELGRSYRTRDGREVRIYAVQCGGAFPVHGAVLDGAVWRSQAWRADGGGDDSTDLDLLEIRPRAIDRMQDAVAQLRMDAVQEGFSDFYFSALNHVQRAIDRIKSEEDAS